MTEKVPSTARLLVRNFAGNLTGMFGLLVIFLIITSAIFAEEISGYNPNLMDR